MFQTNKVVVLSIVAALAAGCATSGAIRHAREAERRLDYDRAVVEYSRALKLDPGNVAARTGMDRAKVRASLSHFQQGRRLEAAGKIAEALSEYQLAAELNPASADIQSALRTAQAQLRAQVQVDRNGKTQLESLIDRTRDLPAPGQQLPPTAPLPESLVFSNASSQLVITALARFANVNVMFDPAFRPTTVTLDLRGLTFEQALNAIGRTTQTFFRVTAPGTVTVIPDTPAKRREYEEQVVRTFYLSNADPKETSDLLRVVMDARQIAVMSANNAITVRDTPERVAATAKLLDAIDKARPEVIIDTELLEVSRSRLNEFGLQLASAGSAGIDGTAEINRDPLLATDLRHLTGADVVLSAVPALYYRLLKSDQNFRVLANPHIRATAGLPAQARFGEEVPVPTTTFAPLAAGGVAQQPITSYTYRNIGVNIEMTPRIHMDNAVTLALRIKVDSISGMGFGGLPTFGNREISTQIRLQDGETNMLAGLIRDDERRLTEGLPGISDLPLVGRMFSHSRNERDQTDIILMLTPHIVRVLDLSEEDLLPFMMGRDAGAGAPPPGLNLQLPGQPPPSPAAPANPEPTPDQPPPVVR